MVVRHPNCLAGVPPRSRRVPGTSLLRPQELFSNEANRYTIHAGAPNRKDAALKLAKPKQVMNVPIQNRKAKHISKGVRTPSAHERSKNPK
jgi:hypothetical protein